MDTDNPPTSVRHPTGMMRYAELYGNIKKPRIKNLSDNKLNALKSFQETKDSLASATASFASTKSLLGEQFGGVAASMTNRLDQETSLTAKWFNPEISAIGKLYYSSFFYIIKITLLSVFILTQNRTYIPLR